MIFYSGFHNSVLDCVYIRCHGECGAKRKGLDKASDMSHFPHHAHFQTSVRWTSGQSRKLYWIDSYSAIVARPRSGNELTGRPDREQAARPGLQACSAQQ